MNQKELLAFAKEAAKSMKTEKVSALKSAPIFAQYPAVHSRAIAPQFPLTYPLRQCG